MSVALFRYWTFIDTNVVIDNIANESVSHNSSENDTAISCHANDVLFIKTYLISVVGIVALNLPLLLLMIYCSAQGSITDTKARHFVSPLLYMKWVVYFTTSTKESLTFFSEYSSYSPNAASTSWEQFGFFAALFNASIPPILSRICRLKVSFYGNFCGDLKN